MDKPTPIRIKDTDNGVTYTLEFNRASCIRAEELGLDIRKIADNVLKSYTIMFRCAFIMHHPKTSNAVIESLMESINMSDIFERLTELFMYPYNVLIQDDGGEEGKNHKVIVEL